MTPADRAALRELVAKATPGPWAFDNRGDKCDDIQLGVACDANERPLSGYFEDEDAIYVEPVAETLSKAADAAFICAARGALPALLDDCDRLERERDEARFVARCIEDEEASAETWQAVNAAMERWDAEDAQAAQKAQGYASCPQVGCARPMPHEHRIEGPANAQAGAGGKDSA